MTGTSGRSGALNRMMTENTQSTPLDPKTAIPPLLREAIGQVLRHARTRSGLTLRQVAGDALVSPGYLSEIERGRKEASSELLASVCVALGVSVGELLGRVTAVMVAAEQGRSVSARHLVAA